MLLSISCSSGEKLPTASGKFNLGVDETMKDAMQEILRVYYALYPDVNVNLIYLPETEIVNRFAKNELEIIVVSNVPDSLELLNFYTNKISVEHYPIAKEKIVFEVNRNTKTDEIKNIFINSINSSFLYFLDDSIKQKYVSVKENDAIIASLKNCLQCATIKGSATTITKGRFTNYIKPHTKFNIPEYRIWYAVNGEPNIGPGSGFVAFLRGVRGQKILSKCNLIPAIPPDILVNLKNTDLFFAPEKIEQ